MNRWLLGFLVCIIGGCASSPVAQQQDVTPQSAAAKPAPIPAATRPAVRSQLRLGTFSLSLSVKDLEVSRAFYEKLGFRVFAGRKGKYLIMQNDQDCTIGLFPKGEFPKDTLLTFNPGWDRTARTLPDYDDVRDIQRTLVDRGVALIEKADEKTTGPAYITLSDPDGNQILIDQHAPSPRK